MKKTFLFVFSFLFMVSFLVGDVFITELADPDNSAGSRYVELYNNGVSAVDFSTGWQLQRATNGNTYWATAVNLTGTITAGGFYIVCANNTTFTATFGFAADQSIGTGGPADSNGDDQIRLLSPGSVVEDMFGILGEDGSGTNHEFEDGRAERKATVITGNTTYTFTEWNIWNDTGAAGTTNDPQDAPADFDPGVWIGPAGSDTSVQFSTGSASVSEGVGTYDLVISINNEDAGNATTCDVVLTVGDAADINSYTTQGVTFLAGSAADQTVTVTITDDGTYEGDETLTFEIQNVTGGNNAAVGATNEFDMTIEDNDPATTTISYSESFASDLGDCYDYSVSGATKEWVWNSGGYAYMSGYNSGDTEEDWFVIPAVNFDNYSDEIMTFDTSYNYGSDDASNYLKLYYSTNYAGIGDPIGSSWVELSFDYPASSSTWTSSGNIDLSTITGTSVYIAFKYHYEAGSYRNWSVDNILIQEAAGPTIENIISTPASPGTIQTVSVSADVTDPDGINSVELHWGTVSGVLGNTISMSITRANYTTNTDIPAQSEGTTVYYEVYGEDNNTNGTTSNEFNYFVSDVVDPVAGDLIITEICGDGTDGDNGNNNGFMEVWNSTSTTLSLSNVQARYFNSNPGGVSSTLDLSGTIAADAYIIITQDETNFNSFYAPTTADFFHGGFYFNGGDDGVDIYLTSTRAETLDEFNDNGVDGTPFIWEDNNYFERTSTAGGGNVTSWTEEATGTGTPGEDNDNPLPVTLSSFYATYINDALNVYWTTESEEENAGWFVYRSITQEFDQAIQLNSGNMIPGQGTVNEATNYSFTDNHTVLENTTYWYWLESVATYGETEVYSPISLYINFSNAPATPDDYGLKQNYPNPFNPETAIRFALEENSHVDLAIYNMKGQKIRTLMDEDVLADVVYEQIWDGTDDSSNKVTSGLYMYKMITNSKTYTKRMLLLK